MDLGHSAEPGAHVKALARSVSALSALNTKSGERETGSGCGSVLYGMSRCNQVMNGSSGAAIELQDDS